MAVDLAALAVGTTGRGSTGVLIPFGWENGRWDQLVCVTMRGASGEPTWWGQLRNFTARA